MRIKIIKYIFLCCLTILVEYLQAQKISDQVYAEYAPPIVTSLYDKVISKIQLGTKAQLFLANAYKAQYDQQIEFLKNRQANLADYKRFKDSIDWAIEESLKKELTTTELKLFDSAISLNREYANPVFNNAIVLDAEMNSQFGVAMKLKKLLQLRDTQIDSIKNAAVLLRSKIKFVKANPDSGFFDKAAFESEYMGKIINDNQYLVLLNEKNKAVCEIQARYLWHALVNKGLDKKFSKEKSLRELIIYYLIKANFTDRFANEKQRRNLMIKAIKQPESLIIFLHSLKTEKEKLEKYAW